MKIIRTTEMIHPILIDCIDKIEKEVILKHNIPIKIFETGRMHDRHQSLILKGKTKNIISGHLFALDNDPPLYATAVDYVYYDTKWSWNLRDSSISSWYHLFGDLVLDTCPELEWGGSDRKKTNFNHFQVRRSVLIDGLDEHPCVTP